MEHDLKDMQHCSPSIADVDSYVDIDEDCFSDCITDDEFEEHEFDEGKLEEEEGIEDEPDVFISRFRGSLYADYDIYQSNLK